MYKYSEVEIALEGEPDPSLPQGDPAERSKAEAIEPSDDIIELPGLIRPRRGFGHYDPDTIDIEAVATGLLGRPPGREGSGGLWWPCPFHDDRNPSLGVDVERGRWKCCGCGANGTAIDLVMRLRGLTFTQAKDALRAAGFVPDARGQSTAGKAPARPARRRSGISGETAVRPAREAIRGLWWSSELATKARLYLNRFRGLSDATIKAARLGFAERRVQWLPGKPAGLFIPWLDSGRLVKLIARQPEGFSYKYREVFRDGPVCYPSPAAIRPGLPLIVCEGELDCLLLGQELGELASVITTGSAAIRPGPAVLTAARSASVVFVAHDADVAGDLAASAWESSIRVRPAAGTDWGEARRGGVDLRRWWTERIGD